MLLSPNLAPAADAVSSPAPAAAAAKPEGREGKPEEKPSGERKPDDKKPPEGKPDDKKPEDKKPDDKKKPDEKTPPTKRPAAPPEPADPKELELRADAQGKIKFNFRGQPWPALLDWLGTVSGMSLDWQELPGDYLNLATQTSYSIPEARDLINRHLLARGYTMLIRDEVLSVVKIENLNPGLVPRVEPEQLGQRLPYEYVKVSFALDWLMAETLVDELKPMISPNGKLTALKTTNRLEAMDAVVNLREIYAVLQQEQSSQGEENLVKEFVLKHVRADEVRVQLMKLLGLEESKPGPMPMSREQMEMMQHQARAMAEMQQQQQQHGRGGPPTPAKPKAEIHLVVNQRRNSILAQAPPDKMAIIARAVETIDMPLAADQSLLRNMSRMQIYRLASLDPEVVVKTLQEAGDLEPTSKLEVDKKNKAIVAYASLADHVTIRTLLQKLDGSARQFEVIRLRRLAADYVSGTIAFMMGQEDKQEDRRPSYYGYFGYYGGRPDRSDEDQDRFRVDADVEGNRLLLWANEVEMGEVKKLLVKLGEMPGPGGNSDRVRVLDVLPGRDTEQLLERLQRVWPSLAPNRLQLPPALRETPAEQDSPQNKPRPAAPTRDAAARASPVEPRWLRLADLQTSADPAAPSDEPAPPSSVSPPAAGRPPADRPARDPASDKGAVAKPEQPAAAPAPIEINVGRDGRLVVSSQDTDALDLLEELVAQLAPARKTFQMFPLKHASSYWVKLNLEDFFSEKDDKDRNTQRRYVYFYDHMTPREKEKRFRLSKRRTLKFIDDLETNSVMVVGADAEQLRTIEELVRLWDTPPPSDAQTARVSQTFMIRYSKAPTIAEAVKDVYRDLLSANDKALQHGREERRQTTTYIFGESRGDDQERRAQVTFKGKLSLGVDDIANTITVSAEGQTLLDNVGKMITALDEAAKPTADVQVVTVNGGVNSDRVREVLARVLGESNAASRPGTQGRQQGPGQQGGQRGGQRGGQDGRSSRSGNTRSQGR
jgi:hypothetical protein